MSTSQTKGETLTRFYYDLVIIHTILQHISILRSSTTQTPPDQFKFHNFFLPHLPLLLTPQKQDAIYNLRKAFIYVSNLSTFADQVVKTRYANFGKALVWALDRVDHLLHHIHESDDLEIMKSIQTIFHLVASLCCREWSINHPVIDHLPEFAAASLDFSPSVHDPVYNPPPKVRAGSTANKFQTGISEQVNHIRNVRTNDDEIAPDPEPRYTKNTNATAAPMSDIQPPSIAPIWIDSPVHQIIGMAEFGNTVLSNRANPVPHHSNYILNNGKCILPEACVTETPKGCHIPFELTFHENGDNGTIGLFDVLSCNVRVLYPDRTSFPYIPVRDMSLLNYTTGGTTNTITERDKLTTYASVEMPTEVYKRLINRLKGAYKANVPRDSYTFLTNHGTIQAKDNMRMQIEIPMSPGCLARIVHLLWFVESPIRDALEMCQHDLFGCGLLKAEFEETLVGTRIVLSLAGVIVERNLLNYGERIFEMLDKGEVCQLQGEM